MIMPVGVTKSTGSQDSTASASKSKGLDTRKAVSHADKVPEARPADHLKRKGSDDSFENITIDDAIGHDYEHVEEDPSTKPKKNVPTHLSMINRISSCPGILSSTNIPLMTGVASVGFILGKLFRRFLVDLGLITS